MRNKDNDCLHCKLTDAIVKHGKQHGGVADKEILAALAEIIGDVLALQDQKDTADMRKFVGWCIDEKIALLHEAGTQPQQLH
jgi:hypothetical protein